MKIEANSLMNHGANLTLLLIGMESICVLICMSFGLPFTRLEGGLLVAVCFFLWIAASFRHGALIGVPLCILLLYFCFSQANQSLASSAHALATQIVGTYTRHFGGNSALISDDTAAESFSAFFLVMSLLSAFVSFSLTSGSFRVSLVRIATFPLFFACILVNGNLPVIPTVGCLIFWVGLQLSGDSFRNSDGSGKSFILGILPCMIVLGGLLLLYRPATYQYDDQQEVALIRQFDRVGDFFTDLFGGRRQSAGTTGQSSDGTTLQALLSPAGWYRSDDELKLDVPFDYSALTRTAMMIRTDVSGTVYLRGRSYGEYTGTSWTAAVDNTHASALNYTARVLSSNPEQESKQFEINTPSVYSILYLPYFTITANSGDISVNSDGLTNYSGTFYPDSGTLTSLPSTVRLPSDIAQEELQYREFVYSYYTRLPDTTRAVLTELCGELSFSKDQEDILARVADYIRSSGIYDLSVSEDDTDDWVISFLTESHRGYCVHYASAAVALFRCLKIPARICEGYMLNVVPNAEMRVTGENAHAWVEVYLDGTGWLPVEVTASSGTYITDPGSESGFMSETDLLSPDPAGNESGPTENEIPSEEDGSSPHDDTSTSEEESEDVQDVPSEDSAHSLLVLVRILFVPVVIVSFFFARYLLISTLRKHRFNSANSNQKIILLYRDAERLRGYGAEIPVIVRELAGKAAFSQHQISPEEVDSCRMELSRISQDTYSSLSKWKRFLFRYYHANFYYRSI